LRENKDDPLLLGLTLEEKAFLNGGFLIPSATTQTGIDIGGLELHGCTMHSHGSDRLQRVLRVIRADKKRVVVQKKTHGEEVWYVAAEKIVVDMFQKNVRDELRDAVDRGADMAKLDAALGKAKAAGILHYVVACDATKLLALLIKKQNE
jgi:hypothetical protein